MADPDNLAGLWAAAGEGEKNAREELILHYLPMVEALASQYVADRGAGIRDDLISNGVLGLIAAIDDFDPSKGVQFTTYAWDRIRGAIIDGTRSSAWESKRRRQASRAVERAEAELQQGLRRAPTEAEIAKQLGVNVRRVAAIVADEFLPLTPIDNQTEVIQAAREDVAGREDVLPFDVDELRANMASTITALMPRERAVVILYYLEELSLTDIGRLLGVSAVRISGIRDEAITKLRAGFVAG